MFTKENIIESLFNGVRQAFIKFRLKNQLDMYHGKLYIVRKVFIVQIIRI